MTEEDRIRWVLTNRLGGRVASIASLREACIQEGVWEAQRLMAIQNDGLDQKCRRAVKGRDANGLPFGIPSYGLSRAKPESWVQLEFASAEEAVGYEEREWQRAGSDIQSNLKVHDYNLARWNDAADLPAWLNKDGL